MLALIQLLSFKLVLMTLTLFRGIWHQKEFIWSVSNLVLLLVPMLHAWTRLHVCCHFGMFLGRFWMYCYTAKTFHSCLLCQKWDHFAWWQLSLVLQFCNQLMTSQFWRSRGVCKLNLNKDVTENPIWCASSNPILTSCECVCVSVCVSCIGHRDEHSRLLK